MKMNYNYATVTDFPHVKAVETNLAPERVTSPAVRIELVGWNLFDMCSVLVMEM